MKRLLSLALLVLAAPSCAPRPVLEEGRPPLTSPAPAERKAEPPAAVEVRGRLVCLAEEMRDHYQAEVPPVHEHLWGFRAEGELPAGAPRWYTLLRTAISEGFFVDQRFQGRTLLVRGRRFPGSALLDVSRYFWLRDGKLWDVYYWCDVCAIRGTDPGRCACCQGQVDLRDAPMPEAPAR